MPTKLYDRTWPDSYSELDIELACFLERLTPEQGGLGAFEHFKRCALILWPEDGPCPFIWNPWSERAIRAAINHRYLSVSGPGGASKSQSYAIWGLINWRAAPAKTLVVMTSTSLIASRKRIWGCTVDYFNGASIPMPGKLVDSHGLIRTVDRETGVTYSDRCGLTLVPGDTSMEKTSQKKLIGMHNERVILIGDELPELSPSLVKAAMGNLKTNPWFQFIGIGNPSNLYDPHGQFSTPKGGWASVNPEMEEWETIYGHAIRFDASKSPNILAGRTIWPFLPTEERMNEAVASLGQDSVEFWRMFRGYWCPHGSSKGIYSDAEIEFSNGTEKTVRWKGEVIPVAFLDLGFTNGGDASMAIFGELGTTEAGVRTLLITACIRITEITKTKTRMEQIAEQYIALCKERKIQPKHAGYDATASGAMFGEFLARLWDGSIYGVDFSGPPSDIPCGTQGRKGEDYFANRVSELWVVGREFLLAGQFRGITPALARQMMGRNMEFKKTAAGLVQEVETKKSYKKRAEGSPDLADAFFGMLDLCRARLKFRSQVTLASNAHAAAAWNGYVARAIEPEKTAVPTNLTQPALKEQRMQIKWGQAPVEDGWGSLSLYH